MSAFKLFTTLNFQQSSEEKQSFVSLNAKAKGATKVLKHDACDLKGS